MTPPGLALTTDVVSEQVRTFLRDQILFGQDAGLSSTTPLLELGILDSFGLFKLVAYLNEHYHLGIGPDQLVGSDFRNIETIANLVLARLGRSERDLTSALSHSHGEGVAVFEVPECAQLFVVFTGLGGRAKKGQVFLGAAPDTMVDSPLFFKRTGLADRNIIIFSDAFSESYRRGVSAELSSVAKIGEWLEAWVKERPYIEEIYCIGVSAGGPVAMLIGDRLKARTVWAFAPRTARGDLIKEAVEELAAFALRVTGKTVPELKAEMTEQDRENIDAQFTPAMAESYHDNLLNPAKLLDRAQLNEFATSMLRGNGQTDHRVYYVPCDTCDSEVVKAIERCPGVRIIPLEPSSVPAPQWTFSRWIEPMRWVYRNHLVLDLLQERGELESLFPSVRNTELNQRSPGLSAVSF